MYILTIEKTAFANGLDIEQGEERRGEKRKGKERKGNEKREKLCLSHWKNGAALNGHEEDYEWNRFRWAWAEKMSFGNVVSEMCISRPC